MNIRTGPFALDIEIYDPMYYGPLTIFPVNSQQEADSISLRKAIDNGDLEIREISQSGSVNTLLAINRGKQRVLILDGEEMIGAKQNRISNTTVLLEAESETKLPVSCVEAGRWGYNSDKFTSSDQFMPFGNRSLKEARMHESLKSRKVYDANQGEVWNDINSLHARHKVQSRTSAMSDAFAARKKELDKAVAALGQCIMQNGLIVFQRGKFVAFEYISSRSVFNDVYEKIIRSLAMDFVNEDAPFFKEIQVEPSQIEEVLTHLAELEKMDIAPVGLGSDYRLRKEEYVGSMLHHEDIQHHVTLLRVEQNKPRIKRKREENVGPDHFDRLRRINTYTRQDVTFRNQSTDRSEEEVIEPPF